MILCMPRHGGDVSDLCCKVCLPLIVSQVQNSCRMRFCGLVKGGSQHEATTASQGLHRAMIRNERGIARPAPAFRGVALAIAPDPKYQVRSMQGFKMRSCNLTAAPKLLSNRPNSCGIDFRHVDFLAGWTRLVMAVL